MVYFYTLRNKLSVPLTVVTLFFFFRSVYTEKIIRFGFCDIQNNQGLGKGCQPMPITPTSTIQKKSKTMPMQIFFGGGGGKRGVLWDLCK